MSTMDEAERRKRANELQRYLDGLAERMAPESHQLLMKILQALNTALSQGGGDTQIEMTAEDKALFTEEFQRELRTVMGMLDFTEEQVVIDIAEDAADQGPDAERLRPGTAAERAVDQRERDRREVESIARASGMEP
ncbi:hypothetical protein [Streptomyces sp. TP-A0874]|uniref:hypothetical protein n=1 Tax=Streptomyces sp. TP-A0874 TaxID=549819 RepID=UPI000852EFB8|nr:hypothetical protein [Streptomyces sp. TP-A0874]